MILPNNPYRVAWDLFVLVLLGFIFVTVPLGLAFGDRFEQHMVIVDFLIDCIFLFDVCLNFRTGFIQNNDEDHVVTDPYKVAYRYLCGWFLLDIISCPSVVFFWAHFGSEFTAFKLLKGAKALKVLKIVKVFRINQLLGTYAVELEEMMFRGSTQVGLKKRARVGGGATSAYNPTPSSPSHLNS